MARRGLFEASNYDNDHQSPHNRAQTICGNFFARGPESFYGYDNPEIQRPCGSASDTEPDAGQRDELTCEAAALSGGEAVHGFPVPSYPVWASRAPN